jgi:hypothetical protein
MRPFSVPTPGNASFAWNRSSRGLVGWLRGGNAGVPAADV